MVLILNGRLPCSLHSADQKLNHHALHFALVRGTLRPEPFNAHMTLSQEALGKRAPPIDQTRLPNLGLSDARDSLDALQNPGLAPSTDLGEHLVSGDAAAFFNAIIALPAKQAPGSELAPRWCIAQIVMLRCSKTAAGRGC